MSKQFKKGAMPMFRNGEIIKGGLAAAAGVSLALSLSPAVGNAQSAQNPENLYGGEAVLPNATTDALGSFATEQTINTETTPLSEADKLREQLAKERAAWHAERRKLVVLAYAKKPTEKLALQLAHATYGVPINGLKALATCESNRTADAQNKTALSGSQASGYTQILYNPRGIKSSTWHETPYAKLSPFDLTTNAMAAGYIWRRNDGKSSPGFGEWRDRCTKIADRAS